MKNIFITEKDGVLTVDINPVTNEDGFNSLCQYLKNEFDAEEIKRLEGPGDSIGYFMRNGESFKLIYDDFFGNSLESTTKGGHVLLREIAEDLEKRFSD
tara:strand:- start:170 stop:466 length:297 start_codon:yes stop_codon:yes gene_type:complete